MGDGVTITSADKANKATFKTIWAYGTDNLTITDLNFDSTGGMGAGYGVRVQDATNLKVMNSTFTDFKTGSYIFNSDNVVVSGNSFTRMYVDAMNFSGINNGKITNNVYTEAGSQAGNNHKDFIQFWALDTGASDASSNVTISGNKFYGSDPLTHGIWLGNELDTEAYQNVTISGNTISSISKLGIMVNNADNLKVSDNVLTPAGSGHPMIHVTPDSTRVTINGNTAASVPDQGNSTWAVYSNTETATYPVYHFLDGKTGSYVANQSGGQAVSSGAGTGTPAPTNTTSTAASDGDTFYFSGARVAGTTQTLKDLDFSAGDVISLGRFDKGTFLGDSGGNPLDANMSGIYVKIDSIVDLQELVHVSPDVTARVSGDDLVLGITQDKGTFQLRLDDLASAYQSGFDTSLF